MTHTTVGIDPGLTGGLAALSSDNRIIAATRMPIIMWPELKAKRIDPMALNQWLKLVEPDIIVMESQNPRPGNGAKSSMTIGVGYGMLLAAVKLICPGSRLILVTPAKWKHDYPKAAPKTYSMDLATSIWPTEKHRWKLVLEDGVAEAALMARWANRKLAEGKL